MVLKTSQQLKLAQFAAEIVARARSISARSMTRTPGSVTGFVPLAGCCR